MQECDGYREWLPTLEKFRAQNSFLLNAVKNKHDKDCGTSFDVAILIKTHWHNF